MLEFLFAKLEFAFVDSNSRHDLRGGYFSVLEEDFALDMSCFRVA